MSLLRKIKNAREWVETPFSTYTTLPSFFQGRSTVSRDRAMRITTVWACIKIRAETIGALPVGVVEYDGRTRIPKDPPAWLQKPNPETTRFELFERTSASIDADGNAYWYLERDRLGRVQEVWVIPPAAVEPYREEPKRKGDPPGPKRFKIDSEEYGPDKILHIPGFTLPGRLRGMNPIEQHAHALGLAASAEEYGEAFFHNDATMRVVISHPNDPGREGAKRMQETFARDHGGLRNAHKPGVLFGGATVQQLTIPNDQAQFIETRGYQRVEICAIFRVPPHKVQVLDRATFSNIEHQGIEWATDGIMPTTSRIEAAVLSAGLLDTGEHLKFNLKGLLRGDTVTRFAAYAVARQWGWMSADDIRELEDENPLPDGIGQTYLEPLNMVPAGERPATDDLVSKALITAGLTPEAIEAITHPKVPQED